MSDTIKTIPASGPPVLTPAKTAALTAAAEAAEDPATVAPPVKKKPGRPRKKPLKKPRERKGVQTTPLNPENIMEMIYDMPAVLKKIFALFKSMAVQSIYIKFEPTHVDIMTVDHLEKSNIRARFHGSKLNHYYCKSPTQVCLNPTHMQKVIKILDKNYLSVAFVLKAATSKSMITIIFKNEMKIDEIREIELIKLPRRKNDITFDSSNYPIKCVFPSKYFKKFVGDTKSFTNCLTINKTGKAPLTFIHGSTDKKTKSLYVVQDPTTIKLVSTVADDDIFSSSVMLDYITPISGAILSDHISMAAHPNKHMLFKVGIDNDTVEVHISTETINRGRK
jgi:hypothetical protein